MFKTLRIVSAVLCALLLAFIIPSVVWFKPVYVIIEAVLALLFFVQMMLFKSLQEMREPKPQPPEEADSPAPPEEEKKD